MADEIIRHAHATHDRVSVTFTRKYNVAQYESLDVHTGLSSDRKQEETIQEAFVRVEVIVETEFEKLCNQIETGKAKKKNRRPNGTKPK